LEVVQLLFLVIFGFGRILE